MNTIDIAETTPRMIDGVKNADRSCELITRSGYLFDVRPAEASDEAGLTEFFTHVTRDDLRFRFLSAMKTVGQGQIERMTHVDHRRSENFLAFDGASGAMIATGMLAADEAMETAEVAIAIHKDFKGRGVGWTLLDHITRFARARGIKTIESIESRDNHQAIELEREMGFTPLPFDGDPSSVIVRHTLA